MPDEPDKQFRHQYWQHIEATVERYGWAVQGVFPTPEAPCISFHYTVGLHQHGLPELIVFALPSEIGMKLLNDIARQLMVAKSAGLPWQGRMEHQNWPMAFHVLGTRPHAADQHATLALARSRGQAEVAQVVWPDKFGHFPWEPEASDSFIAAQPFLCDAPG